MKRLVLVVLAATAMAVAPLAVANASGHKTGHKTVSLSGGQSVSITCSGKSLSVSKSGNVAVLVCARTVKASVAPHVTAPPATASPATAPPATTPPATSPGLTQQQKSAVASAKEYLNTEAFSQQGLIDQLDSPDGSGYSVNDATIAVDSLTVDWNAEAVQAAKEYLQTQPFSCNDLIQQLDSPDGDEFTVAQATYGATQAGDC
jgi:host cell surface-exposed lipoprotein